MSYLRIEKLEKTTKVFFEVSADEFNHALQHAFEHVLEHIKKQKRKEPLIKGFRNEAITYSVYVKHFGVQSLYEDAIDHALNHKYQELFDIEGLDIFSSPSVTDFNIADVKEGEPFTFAFEIENKPEVVLGQYKEVVVNKENLEVSEAEVDKALKDKISKDITLEPKAGENVNLQNGDTAIFDFEGFLDGVAFEGGKAENYELEIGSHQFIPGFEEQMVNMVNDEEKEIKVTFPANYQAENLAGKEVVFKIKLHEIKNAVLPELTEEYIKGLSIEGVNSKEELLAHLKEDLVKSKEESEKNRVESTIISVVCNNATVIPPEGMVENIKENLQKQAQNQAKQYNIEFEMFLQLTGTTKEAFEAQITIEAARRAKQNLVIEEIVKVEGITASDEEVEDQYNKLAEAYKVDLEQVKKYFSVKDVKAEVTYNKAIDLILNSAKRV